MGVRGFTCCVSAAPSDQGVLEYLLSEVAGVVQKLVAVFCNDTPESAVLDSSRYLLMECCHSNYSDWSDSRHLVKSPFAFSALPFKCGYRGDDVVCSKPHDLVKVANSAEAN